MILLLVVMMIAVLMSCFLLLLLLEVSVLQLRSSVGMPVVTLISRVEIHDEEDQ